MKFSKKSLQPAVLFKRSALLTLFLLPFQLITPVVASDVSGIRVVENDAVADCGSNRTTIGVSPVRGYFANYRELSQNVRRLKTEQEFGLSGEDRVQYTHEVPMYQDTLVLDIARTSSSRTRKFTADKVNVTVCTISKDNQATPIDAFVLEVDKPRSNDLQKIRRYYSGLADHRVSIVVKGTQEGNRVRLLFDTMLSENEGQPWVPLDKQTAQTPVKGLADLHLHQTANMSFNGGWFWGIDSHLPGPLGERLTQCDGKHGTLESLNFVTKIPFIMDFIYDIVSPGSKASEGKSRSTDVDDFLFFHEDTTLPKDYVRSDDRRHQQVAFERLKQAHDRGLKLVVSTTVENAVLNNLIKIRGRGVSDWSTTSNESIKRQIISLREIDEQVEWFEVVLDPWHARRVINEGKMAVVIGAEYSDTLPKSDGPWQQQLHDFYEMGLRHLQVVHKLDNRFTSTTNQGFPFDQYNLLHAFRLGEVPNRPAVDRFGKSRGDESSIGTTDDGYALVDEMVRLNMIIDFSHMPTVSQRELSNRLIDKHNYYPIFYSHWEAREPELLVPVKETGGMVGYKWEQPVPESTRTDSLAGEPAPQVCEGHLADRYQEFKNLVDFEIGFSLSSDLGGFTRTGGVNFGPLACQIPEEIKTMTDQNARAAKLREYYPDEPDWVIEYWAQGIRDISFIPGIVYDFEHVLKVNVEPFEDSAENFIRMWERNYDSERQRIGGLAP